MEEDSFNEYFAQKNRIFNNIEDNQIVLSDDDDIILSDDDTKEYNNLDKMEQFNKDYPQEDYLQDDNDETTEYNMYIRNLILEKSHNNQLYKTNEKYKENQNTDNYKNKNKKNIMKLNDLHVLIDKEKLLVYWLLKEEIKERFQE